METLPDSVKFSNLSGHLNGGRLEIELPRIEQLITITKWLAQADKAEVLCGTLLTLSGFKEGVYTTLYLLEIAVLEDGCILIASKDKASEAYLREAKGFPPSKNAFLLTI